jgi:hypothetical protein
LGDPFRTGSASQRRTGQEESIGGLIMWNMQSIIRNGYFLQQLHRTVWNRCHAKRPQSGNAIDE